MITENNFFIVLPLSVSFLLPITLILLPIYRFYRQTKKDVA